MNCRPNAPFAALRGAALGLLLAVPACSRDCGCRSGEKTYETLDGKVKVELIRDTHWSGNHMVAGPVSRFFLRVHTTPPISEPLECSHVDLAENDAGTLVAYRCKSSQAWTVLRLRGGKRYLRECDAPIGTGNPPDFAQLPTLRDSVDHILDCASTSTAASETWPELVQSVSEEDGATAGVKLAIQLCDRLPPSHSHDPWITVLDKLDEDGRSEVKSAVCGKLADAETADFGYVRVAGVCPRQGEGVAESALARWGAALEREEKLRPAGQWAAAIAIHNDAERAGEIACTSLGKISKENRVASLFALGAIGLGKVRCEQLWSAREWITCSSSLDCGERLCSSAEVALDLRQWADGLFEPKQADKEVTLPGPPDYGRALLAAAYAQGGLPRDIVMRNARRHYERPDAGGPSCNKPLALGTPCHCLSFYGDALCRIAGADTEGILKRCRFRFDDEHRKIVDVRRHCVSEGEACGFGDECCPGLRCGGGDKRSPADRCQLSPSKPTGDAAAPRPSAE